MNTRRLNWRDYLIELTVGLFFLAALSILAWYTIILSGGQFGKEKKYVNVKFEKVSGLKDGDSILLRGLVVGEISQMMLNTTHVVVTCELAPEVTLYPGCSIQVKSSSMLGGNILNIEQGDVTKKPLDLKVDLMGEVAPQLLDEAGKVFSEMKDEKLFEKISDVVDTLKEISEKVNTGKGTLGKLVNDETLFEDGRAAAKEIKEAGKSLTKAGDSITDLANSFDETGEDIDKMVADFKKELQVSIDNLKAFTEKLNNNDSTISKLLSDNGALYKDLQDTFKTAKDVVDQVNKGEGTLGKLINDPSLYDDTKATINEVKGTVQDMRETSTISTFGSFIFGAL